MNPKEYDMMFKQYQKLAQETAIYPGKGETLYYPVLGLNGESWELEEKLFTEHGVLKGVLSKNAILLELGDLLWYIQEIAFETNEDLDTIWNMCQVTQNDVKGLNETHISSLVRGIHQNTRKLAEWAKKTIRDNDTKYKIMIGLGLTDILPCICLLGHYFTPLEYNVLGYIGHLNIQKLKDRKQNGTIKGSGDYR